MNIHPRVIFLCISIVHMLYAQEWLGYNTSNYSGIQGVDYNPAQITNSNYGNLDVSIIAANVHVENNFLFVNSNSLTNPRLFEQPDFWDNYVYKKLFGFDKSAMIHANVQSPAFLLQITKNSAIGFCVRGRAHVNADGVDNNLAYLIAEGLDYQPYLNQNIQGDYLSVSGAGWIEYAFTYAHMIPFDDDKRLKIGGTFKLLQGYAAGSLTLLDYEHNFLNNDTMNRIAFRGLYGTTPNIQSNTFGFDFLHPGFSFDFGATFEKKSKRMDDRNKKSNVRWPGIFKPDQTQYKWKVGLSFHDLGAIFFQRDPSTQDFSANINTFNLPSFANGINSAAGLTSAINSNFTINGGSPEMVWAMPARMRMFGDLRFKYNLGINATFDVAFINRGHVHGYKNHFLTQLTITPRWEIKWFGVYMPIWISEYNFPQVGMSFRLGPLVVGTGDFLGHLMKREYASMDVHMGLRLIIPTSKKKKKNGMFGLGDKDPADCPTWKKSPKK